MSISLIWGLNVQLGLAVSHYFSSLMSLTKCTLRNFVVSWAGMLLMTLALARMYILVCGRMAQMCLQHLVVPLGMECQRLGKNSWQGFYTIFLQFWHL